MPFPRPLLLALLCATTTTGLLMVGTPATASATVAPHAVERADRSTYGPTTGAATASPASVSPSGCYQRADYPHGSSHVPGTTSGVVTTTCLNSVPKISHTAQLWETRWWGWDRIGAKGSVTAYDSERASATAWDHCRNNTVRVTGSGYVIDVDGRTYYASTESIHVKNPCGL